MLTPSSSFFKVKSSTIHRIAAKQTRSIPISFNYSTSTNVSPLPVFHSAGPGTHPTSTLPAHMVRALSKRENKDLQPISLDKQIELEQLFSLALQKTRARSLQSLVVKSLDLPFSF
jgi:hypothetical protein